MWYDFHECAIQLAGMPSDGTVDTPQQESYSASLARVVLPLLAQLEPPADFSQRCSGQEAVEAIAELMATFREAEHSCPGLCDQLLQRTVAHLLRIVGECRPSASATSS